MFVHSRFLLMPPRSAHRKLACDPPHCTAGLIGRSHGTPPADKARRGGRRRARARKPADSAATQKGTPQAEATTREKGKCVLIAIPIAEVLSPLLMTIRVAYRPVRRRGLCSQATARRARKPPASEFLLRSRKARARPGPRRFQPASWLVGKVWRAKVCRPAKGVSIGIRR